MFKQYFSKGLVHIKLSEFSSNIKNFSTWNCNLRWSCSYRKDNVGCRNINTKLSPVWPNVFSNFRNMSSNTLNINTNIITKSSNPLNINTNVINNVILYRYEKPWMYKFASGFAIFALIGCLTMADNVYLILCKDLFNSSIDWGVRLKNHVLPIAAISIGLLAGPVITVAVWYITVRTMKYIVLQKGGKLLTFVTYHPVKGEVRMTVPLEDVSCKCARNESRGYISIKIRNFKNHYMIDKTGHFVNPELFDSTVGVKRF